jgi:hypothetical protein
VKPAYYIRTDVVPRWHALLEDIVVIDGRRARVQRPGGDDADADLGQRVDKRRIKKILNGETGHPDAGGVWDAAAEARNASDNVWVAGPMLLFACGHLEMFAYVMLAADDAAFKRGRKLYLVDNVVEACIPSNEKPVGSQGDFSSGGRRSINIVDRKIDARRQHARTEYTRPERDAWRASPQEEKAFEHAFVAVRNGTSEVLNSAAAVTCRIAMRNDEDIPVDIRREIVIETLRHSFGA